MDLSHPLRVVGTPLEASVIEVLAGTSRALSGREVAKLAGRGSPSGVRLVLRRLAEHGLATREDRASATYYAANRNHVAWPAVEALTALDRELERRIAEHVKDWEIQPVTLAMFGSGARRDGTTDSDIDLLLVEPTVVSDRAVWDSQTNELADAVESWTGNRVQIYALDQEALKSHVDRHEPVTTQWRNEAKTLSGQDVRDLLRRLTN